METKRVKVYVKQRKTSDGRTFNVYKAVTKNNRLIDCKFKKDVVNVPTVDSYLTIAVDQMNIAKNTEFPVLWVSAIENVEPINGEISEEQRQRNAEQINDYFD